MGGIQKRLESRLERVFIVEDPNLNVPLNQIKASQQINRRLLVACRRVLEVCQGTLKLQGVSVVLNELGSDGRVEGNAR